MSNSSNGSVVGQVIKGLATLVTGVFLAKKGHNTWKEKNKKKKS